jgi:hypothetical protein
MIYDIRIIEIPHINISPFTNTKILGKKFAIQIINVSLVFRVSIWIDRIYSISYSSIKIIITIYFTSYFKATCFGSYLWSHHQDAILKIYSIKLTMLSWFWYLVLHFKNALCKFTTLFITFQGTQQKKSTRNQTSRSNYSI